MPQFKIPKETIDGPPIIEEGKITLRLDGFKPALSKNKESINYNPVLKVVGGENDGQRIYFNMNSGFRPGIVDLAHAFGHTLVLSDDGEGYVIPGKFSGKDDDLTTYVYEGPMLGLACTADLVNEARTDAEGKVLDGKFQNSIKRFYCVVPGCEEKHSLDLIGKRK